MRLFATGDLVTVEGPPGVVEGEVLEARAPTELPNLGPWFPPVAEVRQILDEWRVDFMILIQYSYEGQMVAFWALHYPKGWRDLRAQELRITKTFGVERVKGSRS